MVGLLLAGAFFLREKSRISVEEERDAVPEPATPAAMAKVDTPVVSRDVATRSNRRPADVKVTSGVRMRALQTPAALPPLTGYVVDRFDTWTTLPASYIADGITVENSTLTLAGDTGSSAPRTGVIVSPPKQLQLPALSAPVQPRVSVPDGAEVLLEISLSDDGKTWSPWAMAQRYSPPDGKRVRPAYQALLSTDNLPVPDDDSQTSQGAVPGPAIKYRLTLTSSGIASPSISDIRIWKQEYQ